MFLIDAVIQKDKR